MNVASVFRRQNGTRRVRQSQASRLAAIGLGCAAACAALIGTPRWSHAQSAADDVAAQIRSQGYQCDWPATAKRSVRRSRPDSTVWILTCRNAVYRVRLDPNMSARVTTLEAKRYP